MTVRRVPIAARVGRIRDARVSGEGFTLTELLVVILIIGVLAAVAIPVLLGQRQSAWKASVQADVHSAVTAIETWGAAHDGSYAGLPSEEHAWNDSTAARNAYVVKFRVSDGNTVSVSRSGSGAYIVTGKSRYVTGTGTLYTHSSSAGTASWGGSTS